MEKIFIYNFQYYISLGYLPIIKKSNNIKFNNCIKTYKLVNINNHF